jgi:DNA-binding NtrC family response regulator
MATKRSVAPQIRTETIEPEDLVRAASLDVTVLVSAADAVERRTYARLLHSRSERSERPFVEIQCNTRRDGRPRRRPLIIADLKTSLVRARSGTLYLDHVASLSVICQAWLRSQLTAEMTSHRVRVISGSDGTLAERVTAGTFDSYLFYRLNVIHIDRT